MRLNFDCYCYKKKFSVLELHTYLNVLVRICLLLQKNMFQHSKMQHSVPKHQSWFIWTYFKLTHPTEANARNYYEFVHELLLHCMYLNNGNGCNQTLQQSNLARALAHPWICHDYQLVCEFLCLLGIRMAANIRFSLPMHNSAFRGPVKQSHLLCAFLLNGMCESTNARIAIPSPVIRQHRPHNLHVCMFSRHSQ